MKIIVASYSKCGTKTLTAALTQLGFKVFDFLENFWYFDEEWKAILENGKVSTLKLHKMYSKVDAVVDAPTYIFWKQLHRAFPEAKIILTVRDEEEWFESFRKQVLMIMRNTFFKIILSISPSGKRLFDYMNTIGKYHFEISGKCAWNKPCVKPEVMQQKYRDHNQDVLQNAPKDLLLVMDLKEGWKPLCQFLNVAVPQSEFPHKNVGGELVETWMKEHPFAIQMKKETYVIMVLFVCILAVIAIMLGAFAWSFT